MWKASSAPIYCIVDKLAHDPEVQRAGEQDRLKSRGLASHARG